MNEHFYFHAEASSALDNENGAYLIEAVKIQAFDDYFALIVDGATWSRTELSVGGNIKGL